MQEDMDAEETGRAQEQENAGRSPDHKTVRADGQGLSNPADASRARVIKIQKEERQVKEIIRISCLFQLAVILDHTPELIERAPARGYVAELMDEADRYGMPGDAKRMLEHRGYTGPTPQETKDEN